MVNPGSLLVTLTDDFLRVSLYQLRTRVKRIETCLGILTDDQIWARRHEVENAVGNLVLHLCGNIKQWVVGGIGQQSVVRDRNAEFAQRDPLSAAELGGRLRALACGGGRGGSGAGTLNLGPPGSITTYSRL